MTGVLGGIRVIDLTTGIAGPMATMLMADNGADVVKVEPPGGDPTRLTESGARVWARGKRSIELDVNDDVQHSPELWLKDRTPEEIEEYLADRPRVFWEAVSKEIPGNQKISGYTTTYNCIKGCYPFRESIASMLGFCDEVVVVDAGSSDGTIDTLLEMQRLDSRIVVHVQDRDWSAPRSAVFDGQQKALARAICT